MAPRGFQADCYHQWDGMNSCQNATGVRYVTYLRLYEVAAIGAKRFAI